MPPLRTGSMASGKPATRRVAWIILIIAVAIPVAFISGRLERERTSAAVSFGEAVAMWDGDSIVPNWLADSVGHPVLLHDLAKRLGARSPQAAEVSISAVVEDDGAGGARWRVRLSWPETPSVDLLVAFEGLDTLPRLVGVGGESAPGSFSQ